MALARRWLWTIPLSASLSALLSLSLKATTSYSAKPTILYPPNIIHQQPFPLRLTVFSYPSLFASSFFLTSNSSLGFAIYFSLPRLFSFSFLVRLRQTVWIKEKGKHEAPPHFSGFSGPHLTLLLPRSSKTWVTHPPSLCLSPTIFISFEKPCWIFTAWRGLDQTSESGWTKQLLVWLIAYLSGTELQLSLIYRTPCEISTTHGKQQSKQWKWVQTAKQLCVITLTSIAFLSFP